MKNLIFQLLLFQKQKKQFTAPVQKENDLLCYTGSLGECKRDLEILLNDGNISSKSKFIKPKLKAAFFYEIVPYIHSALDISDGLVFELERLSKANNLGFEFFYDLKEDIITSGEEYEILFSFKEKNKKIIEKIAKKHKVELNIFAKTVKGSYKSPFNNHHF